MIKQYSVFFLVFIGIAVFFSGCGGKSSVTGQVKFEDGTPLTVGEVIFESATVQARGSLDSSGKFVMGSTGDRDGVPPGQYRVYIGGAQEPTGKAISIGDRGDSRPAMRSLVDPQFAQPATSGWTCDVKGSTKVNFTVTKPSSTQ